LSVDTRFGLDDRHAENAPRNTQDQTFREELPDYTVALRSHRGAYRQLALTALAPSKKEIRHVGARDQEHEP
jgi:hypothetical protein